MGLDYTYMLYFKRDQLADVLQGVSDIAESEYPLHFHPLPGFCCDDPSLARCRHILKTIFTSTMMPSLPLIPP